MLAGGRRRADGGPCGMDGQTEGCAQLCTEATLHSGLPAACTRRNHNEQWLYLSQLGESGSKG